MLEVAAAGGSYADGLGALPVTDLGQVAEQRAGPVPGRLVPVITLGDRDRLPRFPAAVSCPPAAPPSSGPAGPPGVQARPVSASAARSETPIWQATSWTSPSCHAPGSPPGFGLEPGLGAAADQRPDHPEMPRGRW
ncbi:MAG: hypothetical protein ACRDNT_15330 [Streptosporangiaceae bacterium]